MLDLVHRKHVCSSCWHDRFDSSWCRVDRRQWLWQDHFQPVRFFGTATNYSSGIVHQYKFQLNWLYLKDAVKEKFAVLDNVQWFEVLEGKHGKSMPALELMAKDKARMFSMGQQKRLQLARLLTIDRPIWLLDDLQLH